MGCRGSKAKENPTTATLSPDAVAFMSLVNGNDAHPVARRTLEEWSVFVQAHTQRRTNYDMSALEAYNRRPTESWATMAHDSVTHQSVDDVGKAFLQYLKNDLVVRGWAGDFDYAVAGVETQGYLRITAKIEMGPFGANASDEHPWEIRVHYHSKPPARR